MRLKMNVLMRMHVCMSVRPLRLQIVPPAPLRGVRMPPLPPLLPPNTLPAPLSPPSPVVSSIFDRLILSPSEGSPPGPSSQVSTQHPLLQLDDHGELKRIQYNEVFRMPLTMPYDVFPNW